jgi:hypothetical protein
MTLKSTQPLTEMSTKDISWEEGVYSAGAWGWKPCLFVFKSGSLNLLGTAEPVQACTGTALSFFT